MIALRLTIWYGHDTSEPLGSRGTLDGSMPTSTAVKRCPDTAMQ